jgi:histidine triad (HIT) family protein
MADGCIFCAIVRGDAPCQRVAEDEHTLSFLDLFPVAEGHTLVITKEHYENVFETPADTLAAVARASVPVAAAIRRALGPDGLGVFQLNGAAAGQTVFHYHMHLIPRNQGEPLHLHGRKQASPEELAATAERLRDALDAPDRASAR